MLVFLRNIYLKSHPAVFMGACSYIMDNGMKMVEKITDEQIDAIGDTPFLSKEFSQSIVRTAREIVKACGNNPLALMSVFTEYDLCDGREVLPWMRMEEIASTAISYMADNDILESYLEDRYIDLSHEERMYFDLGDEDYGYDDYDDEEDYEDE